jgi:hypothetical protein
VLNDASGHNHHGKVTGAAWVKADGSPIAATTQSASPPPPAPSPSEAVYLDDLSETESTGVYGRLGKHGVDEIGKAIKWQGMQPAHSLFTHPKSNMTVAVAYALDSKYDEFRATAGLVQPPAFVHLTFRVVGDGNTLWESRPQQAPQVGIDVATSVRGVKVLRLEVDCPGDSQKAHAVWIEPRLVPANYSPSPQPPTPSPAPARWPFDPQDGAQYVWSTPENLGTTINTSGAEIVWGISDDERQLYFQRDKAPVVAVRISQGDPFSRISSVPGLPPGEHGTISENGLAAAFVLARGADRQEIWLASRSSVNQKFPDSQAAPASVNVDWKRDRPVLSPDGLTLLARSTRDGGVSPEIWMFTRSALDQPFAAGQNVGSLPSSPNCDMPYYISSDRCFLIASSQGVGETGAERIVRYFMRAKESDPFGPGIELDIPLGEAAGDDNNAGFRLSGDGRALYFESSKLPGGHGDSDIWVTRRVRKR